MTTDPRQLAALIHAQESIASAGLDGAAVMLSLATHARELTGAGGAMVEMVDAQGVVIRAAADCAAVAVGTQMRDAGASGRALAQERLVRWDEPTDDKPSRAQPGDGRGNARSVIAAPLMVEDRAVGVMTIVSGSAQAFGAQDEHAVRVLARFSAHQIVQADRLQEAERESRTDPLTGLGNRRALDECLQRELARHIRYERTLSLILVDLDKFKLVNDTHGHQAGDRVLSQVSMRLREVRGADAAFRLGGDEFALLLPETTADAADLVARRLARQVRDDTFPHEVTATWGIAEATGSDPEELLAAADRELYARKRDQPPAGEEATAGSG